jgi:hypothetical protein
MQRPYCIFSILMNSSKWTGQVGLGNDLSANKICSV